MTAPVLDWWRRRAAAKALSRYPRDAWDHAWAGLPLLDGFHPTQAAALRDMAALFLQQ